MKSKLFAAMLTASLGLAHGAYAALVKGDFQSIGDGFLFTDTGTNLEWLTPFFTRGHAYNDDFVQGLIEKNGFRYATAVETASMISSSFDNPTTMPPGNSAGFSSAQSFFDTFGVNEHMFCSEGPCPRTQGLMASSSNDTSQLAFGMIQLGSTGWMISNNAWPTPVADMQMGSWLVRPTAAVPEPSALAFVFAGLVFVSRAFFKSGGSLARAAYPDLADRFHTFDPQEAR